MKKRVLSMLMALALCLTLLPAPAFAAGADGSAVSRETITVEGGQPTATGAPTKGNGQSTNTGESEQPNSETDTLTEIWFVRKPDSIGRSYDGTTDGSMVSFGTPQFTDGTNTFELTEGTGFTAKKTFDSADVGNHTVTVEIRLIGNAATKYKLKAGEETFTISGAINKAYPDLTVSLSETTCAVGEKLLPLLSVSGAQENAAVTYYYTQFQSIIGYSEYEDSGVIPAIDKNTAINSLDEEGNNTYYVYAKTAATTNYTAGMSNIVELTVTEPAAASVTKADGADGGTYNSLPAALNAAQDGDTVKLLENHVTDADALNALGEDFTFEQYASIVPVVTKTLTLDLNHKTVDYLEVGFTETNEETQKKETLATGNLTVTGEAAYGRILNLLFMAGALDIRSGEIGGSECVGLLCDVDSGSVTVSNGTVYGLTVLEGASVTVNGGSNHAGEWVVASGATLKITDGTFGEVQFTRNGTIAISGGTFKSIKSDSADELQPLMSLLDTQKVHAFYKGDDVQDGNATELADVTVKEHTHTMVNNKCACGFFCTHTSTEGASTIGKDGKCTICGTQFAAGIGETYYTDVKSALGAAADGQTVRLLANVMLPDGIYASKTLTLDLNGHSLSGYSLNVGGLTATSQVRTGNLTVIDSSGGNGAAGVAVRDGGTLVFNPENDSTTLLQLEVWGGIVGLYGGKISRRGLRLNNSITLGDLLPQKTGLAYYCGDTQLTLKEAASKTCDLVVKSCSHGGKNGFDGTNCPYCNAPAVAETALNNGEGNRPWRRFANLQTAIDADRDGGSEFKLLTDVTGDYTIDGTKETGLDLQGHSIKGTVTVKAAAGNNTTTFSNTQNTTTASIDEIVAHRGAKLAGSGSPAVIGKLTLADTTQWKDILQQPTRLGFKVTSADGTYQWYAPNDVNGSQLNNVIINSLPITTKTLNLKVNGKNLSGSSPKVERGTTVQLCAGCNTKDATVEFSILKTGETAPITLSGNDVQYTTVGTGTTKFYVAEYTFNDVGSYTISFTATKDGYSVTSSHKKLTVTKLDLSNAEITFPNGNEAAFNYATSTGVPTFVVTYKGQTLKKDVDFTIDGGGSTYDVGPCTLTIKATDNGDYTGSKSAEWSVRPLKVAVSVGDVIKTYDGTTNLPANATITFKSADTYYTGVTLPLAKGTDYEVLNARYDSADASQEEKTVSFTVKLKNKGYVFDDGTTQKDFTLNGAELDDKSFKINKAAAPTNIPTGTLNVINGTHQTYTYDFSKLLPELSEGEYGTISYGNQAAISLVSQSGYYYDESIVEFDNGVLILAQFYAKDGNMTGQIGTVKVKVTTTNYEDFQLTLVLNAINKIKPTPDGKITASEITYGDTLSKSEISGKMKDPNTGAEVKGTFSWKQPGDTILGASTLGHSVGWKFTPKDGNTYTEATGTATVKVDKAQQYGKVSMAGYTYGQTPSKPTLTDRTGDLNAQVTYSYAAAGSSSVQTWDIQNPPTLNAGTYRMFARIGETSNYYEYNAKYDEFVVEKATPACTKPTGLTAKYGQTLADVKLRNPEGNPDGTWSWMNSSESVGDASTVTKTFRAKFTPTDTDNYNMVENIELEVMVNKADGRNLKTVELEQKYTDASEHTYTPDWSELPRGQTWRYSSEYSVSTGSNVTLTKQDFAVNGSLLTYAISGGKAGDKITLTLKASCDNYGDFTITLSITLTERDRQEALVITGADSVVYGQTLTLTATGGSGTGAVTYRIDTAHSTGEATIDPNTGVLTPVKVGSVSAIATKAGDNDYNDVTSAPFALMIISATPIGAPSYTKITTSGKTLKDAALTTNGSTLNPNDGKLEWVDDKGNVLPDNTRVNANTTYKWRFTPTDTNYTTLTGEIELYRKSSSGGGGSSSYSYYTIKVAAGTGGSISPSGSVSVREGRDQTFTITPDKGYAVANVKIDGKSIGAVKSYTFENVRRTHTIEVIFMKANGNPQTGVFVDVATGSYYEDAVDWAVENGIAQGTDDTHFSPDGTCTRAQAVTFLWRAAGSPAPRSRTMPFTDVPVGSYYYDAVLWAVENGITKGTSDTKFSPNAICTRAQSVTFLYRASGSPAVSGSAAFSDVSTTAFYADAVAWAAKKGITTGIGGGLFGSDNDCTRGQIVTFLRRAMAE